MGAIMDNIVNAYSTLWVDIKNNTLKALPEIDIDKVNKEAKDDIRATLKITDSKNKAEQVAAFLDVFHKNTDQLHFIRDVKDAGL